MEYGYAREFGYARVSTIDQHADMQHAYQVEASREDVAQGISQALDILRQDEAEDEDADDEVERPTCSCMRRRAR